MKGNEIKGKRKNIIKICEQKKTSFSQKLVVIHRFINSLWIT